MTTSSSLAEPRVDSHHPPFGFQPIVAVLTLVAACTVTWTGVRIGPVALSDVGLVAALVCVGPMRGVAELRRLPFVVVVPATVLVVGDLVPGGDDAGRSGLLLGGALVAVFVVVAVAAGERSPGRGLVADAVVLSAVVSSAVALAVALLGGALQLPGVPEFVGRQVGLSAHPTHLGLSAVLGLGLVTGRLGGARRFTPLVAAAVVVLVGGVAVSGSRAAVVAAVVTASVAAVRHRRRGTLRWWVLVGGVALVAGVAMWSTSVDRLLGLSEWGRASASESDSGRLEQVRSAAESFASSPLFGAGSDHLQGAHNVVLQVLAAGGLVLLVALLPLCLRIGRGVAQRADPVVAASSVAVVGWATFAFVQNSLIERMVLLVVALAAAPGHALAPLDAGARPVADPRRTRGLGAAAGSRASLLALAFAASLVATAVFVVLSAAGVGRSPSVGSSDVDASRVLRRTETGVVVDRSVGLTPSSDFDGDGDVDVGVFRSDVGGWYVAGQPTVFLGQAGDVAVPGDYDGDGATERAVFRDGEWFVEGEPATRWAGRAGDVPVPGDYDGDGVVEPVAFRDGVWTFETGTRRWGGPGDVPVPGDYDGDGVVDLAVFRPSVGGWYVRGVDTQFLGTASDCPVPGDYDGDGVTERAVYRPEVGGWFVEGDESAVFLGTATDVPVPADHDGDGVTERAVYRPEVGGWFVEGDESAVFLGVATDVPLLASASGCDHASAS